MDNLVGNFSLHTVTLIDSELREVIMCYLLPYVSIRIKVLGFLAVASVTCLVAILSADCIQTQLDTWRERAARHKNVDYV